MIHVNVKNIQVPVIIIFNDENCILGLALPFVCLFLFIQIHLQNSFVRLFTIENEMTLSLLDKMKKKKSQNMTVIRKKMGKKFEFCFKLWPMENYY